MAMSERANEGITVDGVDVEVSITTSDDNEKAGDAVHLYAHNAAVRAMRAVKNGGYPEEHDGIGMVNDWDRIHELLAEREDDEVSHFNPNTCPQCGSTALDIAASLGDVVEYSCNACGWDGTGEDMEEADE